MGILGFLLFGLMVGLIARALMPGRQSMSLVATTLLGVAGSFAGGFLSSLIFGGPVLDLHTSGVVGSVLGAMFVMAVAGLAGPRRAHA